jgi:hypothetical protein
LDVLGFLLKTVSLLCPALLLSLRAATIELFLLLEKITGIFSLSISNPTWRRVQGRRKRESEIEIYRGKDSSLKVVLLQTMLNFVA